MHLTITLIITMDRVLTRLTSSVAFMLKLPSWVPLQLIAILLVSKALTILIIPTGYISPAIQVCYR